MTSSPMPWAAMVAINISALRLFGFTLQDEPNVQLLRGNRIDADVVDAEVGLPGSIALNTLALDPSQGLVELPVDLEDRTNRIAPGCSLGNTEDGSEFVVTGRRGLPPNPSDPLVPNSVHGPWVVADPADPNTPVRPLRSPDMQPTLVEAQGFALNAQGEVCLVGAAADPVGTAQVTIASEQCRFSTSVK